MLFSTKLTRRSLGIGWFGYLLFVRPSPLVLLLPAKKDAVGM